jgi:hypothetical protein
MFMQGCVALQGGAKQKLISDNAKLNKAVECTAQYLSELLGVKNANGARLANVGYRQMNYLPTPKRVAQLQNLFNTSNFVCIAEDLADRAHKTAYCNPGYNIRVSAYVGNPAYFGDDIITKDDGRNVSTYEVGKFGLQLMNEVCGLCMEWLEELDRVLSDAAGISRTESATSEVYYLKQYLASAIASRLCCVCDEGINDDEISTRVLEELIIVELQDSHEHAKDLVNADGFAVKALKTLSERPESTEARWILSEHSETMREFALNPPEELTRASGSLALKLDVLSRAFLPNIDIDVRVALACFWRDSHGSAASAAADIALQDLCSWNANMKPYSVIKEVDRASKRPFTLPRTTFINFNRTFVAKTDQNRRSALDERGARCVRLLSCILEFAALGVFERGVIASEAIVPVARQEIATSRIAAQTIVYAREAYAALGKDIMEFLSVLYDPSGDHEDEIDKALCAMSRFSVRELATIFDDAAGVLPLVSDQLAKITRSKLYFKVPETYTSFASDMLALLLPLVEQRRSACSIPFFACPNPVLDMLYTVKKTRGWDPCQGSLKLEISDFKDAHPSTRGVLDLMHESKVLVKRLGGGKNKNVYTFDTPTLMELFARACTVSC